jgi:hypothetical protein
MRLLAIAVIVSGLGASSTAHAVGCITGGIAGAAAGHLAHHGVLGAIGGCVAGHEYHKSQQEKEQQQLQGPQGQPPTQRQN